MKHPAKDENALPRRDGEQPGIARRDFLKLAGAGTVAAAVASTAVAHAVSGALEVREDEFPQGGPESTTVSLCGMCPQRCSMTVREISDRVVAVKGNPLDPGNRGGLCPVGQAILQLVYNPDRVRSPMLREGDANAPRWREISWAEATALIKSRLEAIRSGAGAHTVAAIGDGTSELAGLMMARLLRAFGSANFITDESAQPSHGQDLTQAISGRVAYDFENSRYILSFAAPLLEGWMSPVRQMRDIADFRAGWLGERGKLVQIESRLSATAAKADEWIRVNPGTEGVLALGIAGVLVRYQLYDTGFVKEHVAGFENRPQEKSARGLREVVLQDYDPAKVAAITGVSSEVIVRLAHEFAQMRPALAVSPGVRPGRPDNGFLEAATQALNALSGAIDQPGGVLVNREPPLAAWAPIKPQPDEARQPPLHNLSELAAAAEGGHPYLPSALFMLGTNPLFGSSPIRAAALDRIPFKVSFATLLNETSAHADLVLPDCTSLERWEIRTAIPGYALSCVGVGSPAIAPRYGSRPAAQVILELAKAMGGDVAAALPWSDPGQALKEMLVGLHGAAHGELFSERFRREYTRPEMRAWGWPADASINRDEFIELAVKRGGWVDPRYSFGDYQSVLKTRSGKFEMPELLSSAPAVLAGQPGYPLDLNFFQPMALMSAMGANLPYLQEVAGAPEDWPWDSYIEINPATAAALGIEDGDWVIAVSPIAQVELQAHLYAGAMPNVVNIPLGQGHTALGHWASGRGVNPLKLLPEDGGPVKVRVVKR
jgi:anaerobic selenocysteine-containing dehydrogenase